MNGGSRRAGPIRSSVGDLLAAARTAFGRQLMGDEIAAVSSGANHWDLRRLRPPIMSQAAHLLADASMVVDAAEWLRLAHELEMHYATRAVVPTVAGIRSVSLDQHTHATCMLCGASLPIGEACGCAAPENAGRPGP